MAKLYVIHDDVMNVDTFVFMQPSDGGAGSYFYNWCLMQQHRNFSLHCIGEIGYLNTTYMVTDANRTFLVKMPEEDETNA